MHILKVLVSHLFLLCSVLNDTFGFFPLLFLMAQIKGLTTEAENSLKHSPVIWDQVRIPLRKMIERLLTGCWRWSGKWYLNSWQIIHILFLNYVTAFYFHTRLQEKRTEKGAFSSWLKHPPMPDGEKMPW